jgi:hypothetical protein
MKSKFPWRLWRWCAGPESLFTLNADQLRTFEQLVELANNEPRTP